MRKRFCMVVALMVALLFPLRLSALAAEAPVEQTVDELPAEIFAGDVVEVNDLSLFSQSYSFSNGVMSGLVKLRFEIAVDSNGQHVYVDGWRFYYAVITVGSDSYYFPYYYQYNNDVDGQLFSVYGLSDGRYIIRFNNNLMNSLWSFIALLSLCNGGCTFGGSGVSIDYTSILNQISDKLNAIQSGNSSNLSQVTQLLNQVVSSNASVQQAVKDMHSAMVDVITSTNTAVDNLGDELQQRYDDAMSTLDEGLTTQGEVMKDMTGRMDSMETALKDSVGGSFQIDSSASGSVDSVGTEGFEVISSTLDQILSSFSWISSLVAVFLMIVLAKRILT